MNRLLTLALILFSALSFSHLSAYTHESISENTVTQEWPEIYHLLVKKDYSGFRAALYADSELANSKAPNGCFLLESAILARAPDEVIQTLLVAGARVNAQREKFVSEEWKYFPTHDVRLTHYEYRTPLLAAWIIQDHDMMQLLLNYGADIDKVLYEITYIDIHYDGFSQGSLPKTHWFSLYELMENDAKIVE